MNQPVRPEHPAFLFFTLPPHDCPHGAANAALVEELVGDGGIICAFCGASVLLAASDLPALARAVERSRAANNGYRVTKADWSAGEREYAISVRLVPA